MASLMGLPDRHLSRWAARAPSAARRALELHAGGSRPPFRRSPRPVGGALAGCCGAAIATVDFLRGATTVLRHRTGLAKPAPPRSIARAPRARCRTRRWRLIVEHHRRTNSRFCCERITCISPKRRLASRSIMDVILPCSPLHLRTIAGCFCALRFLELGITCHFASCRPTRVATPTLHQPRPPNPSRIGCTRAHIGLPGGQ